jgi:nucleotide-binding universal stress UspA family protein
MRTILIPVRGTAGDGIALAAAGALARQFDSHLLALYPRLDIEAGTRAAVVVGSRALMHDWLKCVELEDAQRAVHAHADFGRFLAAEGIAEAREPANASGTTGAWMDHAGDLVESIVAAARYHDIVVCPPPSDDGLKRDQLGAILVDCGRPLVLAFGAALKRIHTVAIAWKNTPEAAHAVTAAMPILQKARQVVVISANEDDQEPLECVDCAERLANHLRWHGIKTESRMIVLAERSAPEAVLDTAKDIHADLLVMGGYGWNRTREMILGGFTHRVLRGAPFPVFICH